MATERKRQGVHYSYADPQHGQVRARLQTVKPQPEDPGGGRLVDVHR
jgi:hypothetical protein